MRIKIAKKKQQKINDVEGLVNWCERNQNEMLEHLAHGCDYAVLWEKTALRYDETDAHEDCVAYVASILGYIASHHPHLLGSEYQYAVQAEAVKHRNTEVLQ